MMYILVEYDGKMVAAQVVGDFAVKVITKVGPIDAAVRLDQCKKCGVWTSEDDELYGDGYCTQCAEICFDCEIYCNADTMTPVDDSFLCPQCAAKRDDKECPCRKLADEFADLCSAGSEPTSKEADVWMKEFREEHSVVYPASPENSRDWCCHLCGKIVYRAR